MKKKRSTGKFSQEDFKDYKAAVESGNEAERIRLQNKIMVDNIPLARHIARRYQRSCGTSTEIEELEQAAHISVVRALQSYDPSKGAWSTYYAWWAIHAVQRAITDDRKIPIPRTTKLSDEEMTQKFVAISNITDFDFDIDKFKFSEAELLIDYDETNPDEWDNVEALMACLTPLQFSVARSVILDEKDFQKIAKELCITRQKVSEIYDKAMAKMKERSERLYGNP